MLRAFFVIPLLWSSVITAQEPGEEAECVRWELLDQTAVTATLGGGAAASPAEACLHRSDGWRGRYSQHATQTHRRRHATGVTGTHTPRMGGLVTMATSDWSPELCKGGRGRELMTGKKRRQRMQSKGIVGKTEANGRAEPHTNVPRTGWKKCVFGRGRSGGDWH